MDGFLIENIHFLGRTEAGRKPRFFVTCGHFAKNRSRDGFFRRVGLTEKSDLFLRTRLHQRVPMFKK